MQYAPATCPSCKNVILVPTKTPFLICPACSETLSASEAQMLLDTMCSAPNNLNSMITKCLELEKFHGEELPLQIMVKLAEYHPHSEEAAWLIVRMSGFDPANIKTYLSLFSATHNSVPWAEDFLDGALCYKNMLWGNLFEQYINNKVPKNNRNAWNLKLSELKKAYTARTAKGDGVKFLYPYYVISSLLNVGLAVLFLLVKLNFFLYVLITAGTFLLEILILYLHHRRYGNRIGMSDKERLLVVIFMCSIVIASGGIFIGTFVRW